MNLFRINNFWSRMANSLRKWYIYLILLIIYIPLITIVFISFNGQTDRGNINLDFWNPTVQNYQLLFLDDEFLNAFLNSLLVSVTVVPISIIIATLTCFGLWNAKNSTQNIFLSCAKTSIVSPEQVTGISLAILFASTWVAIGFDLGFFTVVLAHISFCTPYAIICIFPRMQKMPKNLILASYDLGYGSVKTFFKVTIPYLLPAILSGAAMTLAMSLDDFIITILVNGDFDTIGTAIYSTRKGIKAWVVTFGAIVVILTIAIIMVYGIRKYYVEKRKKYAKKK